MIAAAVRLSEALNARWQEVNLDEKLWTLPAARAKSSHEHVAPLNSIALAVLERQARVRSADTVFGGRSGSPLSYNAFATAPMKVGIDAACPHGWRSVFRDFCSDVGRIDSDLAEAALAHSLGAVEGAYRRESAIEARRPAMEAYAQWLAGDAGADVIVFSARA